jgi:hypothetical protein
MFKFFKLVILTPNKPKVPQFFKKHLKYLQLPQKIWQNAPKNLR